MEPADQIMTSGPNPVFPEVGAALAAPVVDHDVALFADACIGAGREDAMSVLSTNHPGRS